ncbi:hypothetical protein CAC42_5659 [Sphaceloma murrayae]|uniref:BTB domain-containing protein n=1 Tax=Sphaceloma murrayae TaxID=2082308 RepID=A0A2K1QYV2_9PEZI|nr:hypothetical protein CAC42_5659 [Sphaceloma murrayae]
MWISHTHEHSRPNVKKAAVAHDTEGMWVDVARSLPKAVAAPKKTTRINRTVDEPKQQRLIELQELFISEVGADCKVVCGARSWNLHVRILAEASPYFKAAFQGCFKEAEIRIISILDNNEDVVNAFLSCIYGKDVSAYIGGSTPLNICLSSIELFLLADEYQFESVRRKTLATFKTTIENNDWSLDSFGRIVHSVWEHAGLESPLRDIVLEKLRKGRTNTPSGVTDAERQRIAARTPDSGRRLGFLMQP